MWHRAIYGYFLFRGSANSGTRQEPGAPACRSEPIGQTKTRAVELAGSMTNIRKSLSRQCKVTNCDNVVGRLGAFDFCNKHYQRFRLHGTTKKINKGDRRFIKVNGKSKRTQVYSAWLNMHTRCNDKSFRHYHRYGGRGVSVCAEWHSFDAFHQWAIKSGIKPSLTLDRIDNDGNYEPSNCRWATRLEQANNTKNTSYFTHKGLTLSLSQWATKMDVNKSTLYYRIRKCGIEKALSSG